MVTDDGHDVRRLPHLWAHSPATPSGTPHYLVDHLQSVSGLAACFGRGFGGEECCRILGQNHDLGKANPESQDYIRYSDGRAAKPGIGCAPRAHPMDCLLLRPRVGPALTEWGKAG
jgi:hypothetical protein